MDIFFESLNMKKKKSITIVIDPETAMGRDGGAAGAATAEADVDDLRSYFRQVDTATASNAK